jgi:hypothetical protein
VLVSVEGEVLSDEFIDDEVFIGEFGSCGGGIVEGAEDLCSDFGPNLGKHAPFFESFLEDVLEFVNACHIFKL